MSMKKTLRPVRVNEVSHILDNITYKTAKKRGTREHPGAVYVDEVFTFDIETTSFSTPDGRDIAWMYCWQFWLFGRVVMGRTWEEFHKLISILEAKFSPNVVPIYVHYLGFEFSFMCTEFYWSDCFCVKPRTPVRCRTGDIEFRDSLVLSGLPLELLPTETKKLKGDLDYSKIRHEKTPLTKKEINYCINDVVVLAEYIKGKLGEDNMATIPMTRTGYVRRDVRRRMTKAGEMPRYLTITPEQYDKLRKVYAGGFTHAGAATSGLSIYNVRSLDLTSSYPTVMVAEYYPVSTFKQVSPKSPEELAHYINNYACMFRLRIEHLTEREDAWEHIISKSKCTAITSDAVIDNGRVVSAEAVELYCNEIDLMDIQHFYTGDFYVDELEVARKGRLPKSLVEAVLYYYAKKTELKGVDGQEIMYAKFKEYVNAIYGMCVTSIVKPEITYKTGEGWMPPREPDIEEAIDKHNRSRSRALYYPWGVWVTSYARHNLYNLMQCCGYDYLYSDTDSLKIVNYWDHKAEFDRYNRIIVAKLRTACRELGIDPDMCTPKNKYGERKPLGIWSDEGEYIEFKTLGAKRYLTETPDGLHPTVAGAPKKAMTAYIEEQTDPFGAFSDKLVIPKDKSGKNIHKYHETEWEGLVTDYTGKTCYVYTASGTHVAPTTVSMTLSPEYLLYLATVNREEWIDLDM